MPIVDLMDSAAEKATADVLTRINPTYGDVLKANFSESFVGASIDVLSGYATREDYVDDPSYDPMSNIDGYEGNAGSFVNASSQKEVDDIKKRIDEEYRAREIISSAGVIDNLTSSLIVGAVDPLNYISLGSGSFIKGAAILGSGVLAEEVALHNIKETKTAGETVASVTMATILGGVLGKYGSRIPTEDMARMSKNVENEFAHTVTEFSTVGAKQVAETTAEQEQLVSAFGAEKLLKFNDPVLYTLNSPSKTTRKLSEIIADSSLYKKKNLEGIASEISLENKVKGYDVMKYHALAFTDDAYLRYRRGTGGSSFARMTQQIKDVVTRQTDKISYREFGQEVQKAMRRGDTHEISEVAETARFIRENVINPIYQKGVKAGIFEGDEAVKTAESYAMRIWDKGKVLSNLPEFQNINYKWLVEKRNSARAELNKLKLQDATEEIKNKIKELEKRTSVEDAELYDIAGEIVDRIKGGESRLAYEQDFGDRFSRFMGRPQAGLRGAAKSRVYDIPDLMVEDYLVNDLDQVLETYVRSLAADTEIVNTFGTLDLDEIVKPIQADYAKLARGADAKAAAYLDKLKQKDIRNIKAMVERIRGTYGASNDHFGQSLRKFENIVAGWNYATMLGGMTISAFTDPASIVLKQGLGNFVKGADALISDYKGFAKAAENVKECGTALDMVLATRSRAISGMDEIVGGATRAEQAVGRVGDVMSVVSLMSPWNSAMKQFAGVIVQSRIIDGVRKLSKGEGLVKNKLANLSSNGIDKNMALRIAAQLDKHGEKSKKIFLANSKVWDDVEAKQVFESAVRKEVDTTIVTPGLNKPLWMSRPGMKLIGQFKSFAFASVQQTMLAGLQRRDMSTLNGFLLANFLGMSVYGLKTISSGREVSDDWRVWVSEGVDRSGLTGWLFDANNIVEKITRGQLGVNRVIGGPVMSRYASRSAAEAILGPTYGQGMNLIQVIGDTFAGEWNKQDTTTIRKLIPFQNLFYIRNLFDQAEKGVNASLGVNTKPRGNKSF